MAPKKLRAFEHVKEIQNFINWACKNVLMLDKIPLRAYIKTTIMFLFALKRRREKIQQHIRYKLEPLSNCDASFGRFCPIFATKSFF